MSHPVLILAGGLGTRLGLLGELMPKPLVQIGGIPMIVHIINLYVNYGCKQFYILAGYQKEKIMDFFDKNSMNCEIQIIDTGTDSLTGTRLAIGLQKIEVKDFFYLTYGDGIGNISIKKQTDAFISSQSMAMLTGVKPPPRYGNIEILENHVISFQEKKFENHYVNGGYYIFRKEIYEHLPPSDFSLEEDLMPNLAANMKLNVYKHDGFWFSMDTRRDVEKLNEKWNLGELDYLSE